MIKQSSPELLYTYDHVWWLSIVSIDLDNFNYKCVLIRYSDICSVTTELLESINEQNEVDLSLLLFKKKNY